MVGTLERAFEEPRRGRASLINRAERFLSQLVGGPSASEWSDLQTVWLIRNAIVHNDGKPKAEEQERIKRFVYQAEPKAPPDIRHALGARLGAHVIVPVRVRAAVCGHALDTVDRFLTQLDEALGHYFSKVGDDEGIERPYDDYEPPEE